MFAKSVVAVALLAGFTAAQNSTTQVDIPQIPLTTRAQWCTAQQNACPELCGSAQLTAQNLCDAPSLVINCTCTNGTAPGLQYYINTVPTFLCEELHTQCKTNNAGNANAQKACDQAEQANCGKLDPAKYTPPSTSSSSSSSGSPSATPTNAAASSGTAPASSSSSAAAAPTMAISRELGTGIFAAGAVAAFGLMI